MDITESDSENDAGPVQLYKFYVGFNSSQLLNCYCIKFYISSILQTYFNYFLSLTGPSKIKKAL